MRIHKEEIARKSRALAAKIEVVQTAKDELLELLQHVDKSLSAEVKRIDAELANDEPKGVAEVTELKEARRMIADRGLTLRGADDLLTCNGEWTELEDQCWWNTLMKEEGVFDR